MRVTVKKWGNSASIRIPVAILSAAAIRIDDQVDIREEDGRIIVEPLPTDSDDIKQLVGQITPDNLHEEIDFGPAVGKEAF